MTTGQKAAPTREGGMATARRSRHLLLVVLILVSVRAFTPDLAVGSQDRPIGHQSIQALWLAAYAAVAAGLLFNGSLGHRRIQRPPIPLLAVPVIALASVAWSVAPVVTLERAVYLTLTVTVAALIWANFSLIQMVRALRDAAVLAALASLLAIVLAPERAADALVQDAYRGIFTQKNLLGRFMALGLLAQATHRALTGRRLFSLASTAVMALLGLTLTLSASATGLLVAVGLVALVVGVSRITTSEAGGLAIFMTAVAGSCAIIVGSSPRLVAIGLGAIGKDPTLTSRTHIWDLVWQALSDNILLGFGYGAFWRGLEGPSGPIWRALDYPVAHAHNGFLDVWLQLGLSGIIVVAVLLVGTLRRCVGLVLQQQNAEPTALVALLTFIVLYNINESNLFAANSLYTLLLVYVVLESHQRRPVPAEAAAPIRPNGG